MQDNLLGVYTPILRKSNNTDYRKTVYLSLQGLDFQPRNLKFSSYNEVLLQTELVFYQHLKSN